MNLSPDVMRYLIWVGVVVLGMMLAEVDRRVIGRWLFGFLLVAGVVGGLALTVVSPFSFGGSSYYMEGVIISAGSAMALIGYLAAALARFLTLRLSK